MKVVRKPYEIEAIGPMTLENRDEMIAWVESKGWNVHKGGPRNPDNYFWVGDDDHPPVVKQGYYIIYDPVREGVEVLWPSEFLKEYDAIQEPR